MLRNEWRQMTTALVSVALFSGACGDSSGPTTPVVVQPGRLSVSVHVSGGDPDDRYDVIVDATGAPRVIGQTAETSFDIAAGVRSITLAGVNQNCIVTGPNPVSVTITAGVTSNITFVVTCEATGVSVTVSTSGVSIPAGFQLLVDNPPPRSLAPNSVTVVSALAPGTHSLTLSLFAENCTVTGGATRSVMVVNRTLAPVRFDVTCDPIVRTERIAYAVLTSSQFNTIRVGMVKPDGTGLLQIAGGHSPAWSRNGNTIVFSTMECPTDYYYYYYYDSPDCTGGLVLADPETRVLTQLLNMTAGTEPAFSPSGTEIAFIRCCAGNSPAGRLYIARLDGSPAAHLVTTSAAINSISSVADPTWSPDAQRLAFMCMVVPGNYDICTIKRDGSGLTRLTSTPLQHEEDPSWSPDGSTIAFTLTSATSTQVALMPAAGGPVTPLVSGFNPDWSRDGTKLVFGRNTGLFTMNANGSGVVQLTSGGEISPAWRP